MSFEIALPIEKRFKTDGLIKFPVPCCEQESRRNGTNDGTRRRDSTTERNDCEQALKAALMPQTQT